MASHPHDHAAHGHVPAADMGPAFAIGIGLNAAFVAAEAAAGLWSGSLALLADAGHNLSDVLALGLAWVVPVRYLILWMNKPGRSDREHGGHV